MQTSTLLGNSIFVLAKLYFLNDSHQIDCIKSLLIIQVSVKTPKVK